MPRTDTPDSLQNIKLGSRRAEFDDRLHIDRERDVIYNKLMPSVFHETPLQSLLVWHRVDTLILTGGSTSGCVRATCVDSLAHGYRTIVAEECVADKHEIPHFANLCDMLLKYADVVPVAEVIEHLDGYTPANSWAIRRDTAWAVTVEDNEMNLRPLDHLAVSGVVFGQII